jgi:2-(1,2-epoxy-1,2-dihydrophenyl)acetyl-CoA isomerase
MANRVVPDDKLEGEAGELVEKLAAGPTVAYANFKKLLNRRVYGDIAGQLEAEADAQKEQGNTQDFIEGVVSFIQKRPAEFKGA